MCSPLYGQQTRVHPFTHLFRESVLILCGKYLFPLFGLKNQEYKKVRKEIKHGTKKKDNNAASIILVIVGVIAWGVYVAVRALINLNERFIESVSNPAGIIGLFFGLLVAVALALQYLQSLEYAESEAA